MNLENLGVRKYSTFIEQTFIEGGKDAGKPITLIVVAAVLKNPWAGQGFVEDGTQRVDVGCRGDLLAGGLLRRQVGRSAEHGSLLREPSQLGSARDPEIGDLEDTVLANEEVRGLHVPVHETRIVRMLQPRAGLQCEWNDFHVRDPSAFRDRRARSSRRPGRGSASRRAWAGTGTRSTRCSGAARGDVRPLRPRRARSTRSA